MILDSLLMFATSQAITADAVSENTIDMGAYGSTNFRDLGAGAALRVFMNVEVAFSGGSFASLDVQLVTDSDPALASPTVVAILKRIVIADLTINTIHDLGTLPSLRSQTVASERYLGLKFDVDSNPSAGTISAGLISDFQASHRVA